MSKNRTELILTSVLVCDYNATNFGFWYSIGMNVCSFQAFPVTGLVDNIRYKSVVNCWWL